MIGLTRDALDRRLDLFGEQVRAERQRQGMSLARCADRVLTPHGVMSLAMLGSIERGQRRPTLAHAVAISEALNVPLSALLDETPQEIADAVELAGDIVEALDEVLLAHGVRGVLRPAPSQGHPAHNGPGTYTPPPRRPVHA